MNLFQSINNSLDLALSSDPSASKYIMMAIVILLHSYSDPFLQLYLVRMLHLVECFDALLVFKRSMASPEFLTLPCVNKELLDLV